MNFDALNEIFAQCKLAYTMYDEGRLDEAKVFTLELEAKQDNFDDEREKAICRKYVAGCLIDLGSASNDEKMVKRGIAYVDDWITKFASPENVGSEHYNLGNGHFSIWRFSAKDFIKQGIDGEQHRNARNCYRVATQKHDLYKNGLGSQAWTNYGNLLDSIGRSVEAINAYEVALRLDPTFAMALGNKAICIISLAPLMQAYTHSFYLEAIRLLQKALEYPLNPDAKTAFQVKLKYLYEFLSQHGEMQPEHVTTIQPTTKFHRFLCEFCSKQGLFLNPVTFLGDESKSIYSDPIFISTMYAQVDNFDKFDRYVTFLNEIKQDYVLGRFFLVQSQYPSDDIDAVDEGISLYYPLDYSLQSTYIQLLKAAEKQAIAVLDKVAYFIYDYCKLRTPTANQVSFRKLWGGNEKIRTDLANFNSIHLLALFSLANDVSSKGDWSVIFEHRDALTHRFLVFHDFQMPNQSNTDIPRVNLDIFLNNTILALKIARAAIIYLILFVEEQEQLRSASSTGKSASIGATPLDKSFRYKPQNPRLD